VVDYYLPHGEWTHFLTGETKTGGRWYRETHDVFSLPLYVRPDTLLPVGANEARPDYDYADGVTVRVYGLTDGQERTITIPDTQGNTALSLRVRRTGAELAAEADREGVSWHVEISPTT
jgi:alpha-D-xyloside xylohydrolase